MNVEEPPEGARTVAGVTGGALFGWAVGGPFGAAIGGVFRTDNWRLIGRGRAKKKEIVRGVTCSLPPTVPTLGYLEHLSL